MAEVVNRHYYRCSGCLSVTAAESEHPVRNATCEACGGKVVHLGRVEKPRNKLVKDAFGSPCDGRCTGASGPNCDCHCGGKNHGTNLIVPIIVNAGNIPTLRPLDFEAAVARAKEWETRRAEVRAKLDEVASYWLNESFRRVFKLKSHKGRLKALAEIEAEIPAELRRREARKEREVERAARGY